MPFQTQPVDGKQILVQTLAPGFAGSEMAALFAEAVAALDRLAGPVFYVLDVQATDIRFGDVVQGASLATSGEHPAFHHPNVIETLVVTRETALRIAAEGLATPLYGSVRLRLFDTLAEALAYCDANSAATAR